MFSWSFDFSWLTIVFAVLAVCFSLYLSFRQLQQANKKRGFRILLEFLRILAVMIIAVMLFKPELITRYQQKTEPEIAVLCDRSGSMKTADIIKADGGTESRKEWLDGQLSRPFYAPLEDKFKIIVELFTIPQAVGDEKDSSPDGTDLSYALSGKLNGMKNLRAVILLSDGSWNTGVSPMIPASELRRREIPVYAVGVGNEDYLPDLILSKIRVPAYCLVKEKIAIPFQITNRFDREIKTSIRLMDANGTELGKQERISLPPRGHFQGSIYWTPEKAGSYQLSLDIPVVDGEVERLNNTQSFTIEARTETLKVLIVDSLPRWEYRYLRNALTRDPGVDVKTILFHPGMKVGGGKNYLKKFPDNLKELSSYDVVFIGDVGIGEGELDKQDVELLKGLVEHQGSGLVFMPGHRGRQLSLNDSALSELMPVELDKENANGLDSGIEAKLELTSVGAKHFLTMLADDPAGNPALWRDLPGFYWSAMIKRVLPGSKILAVHSSKRINGRRMPLLVIRPFGNGNVLFMGTDSAWRWRKGVEDKYHYRFWGQVIRWMAHKRHLGGNSGIRFFYSPEKPKSGQKVFLYATVCNRIGFPVKGADVELEIKSETSGLVQNIKLSQENDGEWGVYKGEFTPETGGTYDLKLKCDKINAEVTSKMMVGKERKEKIGEPAKWKIMREIAGISRGKFFPYKNIDKLMNELRALPENRIIEKRLELWNRWWLGAVVMLLLSIYWVGRKFSGQI